MRYITLAAATLAALAFAGAGYADSNIGPRRNGDQCWHHQIGNSFGYWSPCRSAAAEAERERLIAAGRTTEEADEAARNTDARGAQATRTNASSNAKTNASSNAKNNTRKK